MVGKAISKVDSPRAPIDKKATEVTEIKERIY